ncbi:hypothetical protein PAPYR_10902 [Paratrimastix pyriformis]|uniref:Uncharacterized protein n=1 Tax=Paratrimastix pyriformis TaxID=342808 RepID=A0ABQ8UC53_9EUKA|nr:hypothetical protein PAPYR_10902 [Paratrimastix pyriformis]
MEPTALSKGQAQIPFARPLKESTRQTEPVNRSEALSTRSAQIVPHEANSKVAELTNRSDSPKHATSGRVTIFFCHNTVRHIISEHVFFSLFPCSPQPSQPSPARSSGCSAGFDATGINSSSEPAVILPVEYEGPHPLSAYILQSLAMKLVRGLKFQGRLALHVAPGAIFDHQAVAATLVGVFESEAPLLPPGSTVATATGSAVYFPEHWCSLSKTLPSTLPSFPKFPLEKDKREFSDLQLCYRRAFPVFHGRVNHGTNRLGPAGCLCHYVWDL